MDAGQLHEQRRNSAALAAPLVQLALVATLLAVICQPSGQVEALSTGAPGIACVSLRPLHALHRPKPASASQFFVTQSALSYSPGHNITVELATHSSERFFRGFLIQAYDPISGQPIGHFLANSDSRPLDLNCSAATHRSAQNKQKVSLTWSADTPASSSSSSKQVRFRATIVVTYQEFYTGFESSELNFKKFNYFQTNNYSNSSLLSATSDNSTTTTTTGNHNP